MSRLFEKVDLRGEGELAKIQELLDAALEARLQEAGEQLTDEDREALRAASAEFGEQLRQFVVFSEEEGTPAAGGGGPASTLRTHVTPGLASLDLRSPLLQPLSPPPADAEVAQLEREVTEASLRVAELRTSMQAKLQEQLAAKLAACRPTAELQPAQQPAQQLEQEQQVAAAAGSEEPSGAEQPAADAAAGEQQAEGEQQAAPADSAGAAAAGEPPAAAAALQLSPQPEALQQRLLQAANRMPALRARLEQATDRLQRVVAAVAADLSRPPPNTVEKAVLGKTPGRPGTATQPGAGGAGGGGENEPRVSPLFKQALESGQISTRRRMARDVQPVPYSQPE